MSWVQDGMFYTEREVATVTREREEVSEAVVRNALRRILKRPDTRFYSDTHREKAVDALLQIVQGGFVRTETQYARVRLRRAKDAIEYLLQLTGVDAG